MQCPVQHRYARVRKDNGMSPCFPASLLQLLQKYNHPLRLQPLPDVVAGSSGIGGGAAGMAAAGGADVDAVLRALQGQLQGQQTSAMQPGAAADMRTLLQVRGVLPINDLAADLFLQCCRLRYASTGMVGGAMNGTQRLVAGMQSHLSGLSTSMQHLPDTIPCNAEGMLLSGFDHWRVKATVCVCPAQGVMRYGELLSVLRGRRPSDLLTPPAPPGYVWSRVQQLADSSCMQVGSTYLVLGSRRPSDMYCDRQRPIFRLLT